MATRTMFDLLLSELSRTRMTYENQRAADAPLADRASTLNKLHSLRSEIAGFRSPR
ncbi:MAG TPA: hypothetical protein VLG28_11720 [Acidimicrobiia bacterium]|nr:hypothetical protein [Acidimicrobiia bacterium]